MIQTELHRGRLFDEDAYTGNFDAVVCAVEEREEDCRVLLDRTAFFPEGGGQLCDMGTLGGYAVTDVRETEGRILHTVKAPTGTFNVGDTVCGEVDMAVRFSAMQCHSAEHIISGLIHAEFGYENVGFHLGREEMTLDTSGVLTKADIDRIERLANAVVHRNVPIYVTYPSAEELAVMKYRAKIPLAGRVRIVTVEGVDCCACCAPHVRYTGEIGLIHIVFAEKHRGGMRLYVKAGERALRHVRTACDALDRICAMLSSHMTESADAVGRLLNDRREITFAYKTLLHADMRRRGAELSGHDPHVVTVFSADTPTECVRTYLNEAIHHVKGIAVALLPKEGGLTYLMASEHVDLRACLPAINGALQGRGGGTSSMVQGTFVCDEAAVRSCFSALVL